jgi:large-conductance mechanosensitive channel
MLSDFFEFLNKKNIVNTGIGIVVGTQVRNITDTVSRNIIFPIVEKSLPKDAKLKEAQIELIGIKFKIGELIIKIIESLLILFLIYVIFKINKKIEASKGLFNLFGLFR